MDLERILHLTKNEELNNVNMINECIQSKPSIVFMVAPWCGHCQRLEPTIDTLEKELIQDPQFNKLHIVKVHDEYLSNVNLNAKGYPTISLFSDGKHVADHAEDRTPSSIKDFISNNISKSTRSGSKPKKKKKKKRKKPTKSSGMIETFNIKEKYNSKKNYNGPGSKDPNWLRKSLNIKPIKKQRGSKKKIKKKKKKTKKKSKRNNYFL